MVKLFQGKIKVYKAMKLILKLGLFVENLSFHFATAGLGRSKPQIIPMPLARRIPLFAALAVFGAWFAMTGTLRAQPIYSQNFATDDSANWAVNYSHSGSNYVNFNFDYTTIGLPPAPHSTGGNTKGLKLSPDVTAGSLLGSAAVPGVSVSPTNFSVTANFDMHVDMWINYNGAIPAPATLTTGGGGSGSTLLYGCGYGTAGNAACVAGATDAILVGTTTDNGTSAEMRMYGPSVIGQASYQNGDYQSTGTTTPGYPGEPFVYNNPSGTRAFYTQSTWSSLPSPNWTNYFPSVKPPQAQINLFPQQTNIQCNLGAISFGWHDVEVEKIGNVIVYLIDGHLAATGNYSSAGTPGGSELVFTAFDINSTISTDPNFANLNFVVFANIVVSNLANVVNVAAPTPTTSEATPNLAGAGVFTLTRSSSGSPLTVNYKLSGTATNGFQYSVGAGATTNSVTFAAGDLTTNISIVPIDDGIPNLTTTAILTLQVGPGYAAAGSAVVSILDNDATTIDITNFSGSQAYGRYTAAASVAGYNDFISYQLTRRGKLTIGSDLSVNLTYGGSAVSGTDYTPVSSVTIPDGTATVSLSVPPLDNAGVTTNRTVTVSVASGTGYAVGKGPGTGTVVSAHNAAPISTLLSDNLISAGDASNWRITYGCGDLTNDPTDYEVNFGMLLASAAGGVTIPPPPGGNANALHLTCNKDASPGSAGAVNVYYTNLWLSGDYAVRFSMNLIEGQTTATATEGAVFGINHSGSLSNWWYGSGPIGTNTFSSDGVWYYITAQPAGSAAGDYQEFTGLGGTNGNSGWQRPATQAQSSYTQVFKDTPGPFTCLDGFGNQTAGVPAEGSPAIGYDASTWSDVEIKQQKNIVTMSINHTPIFVYTNTTVWKGGYLMLGYSDPYGTSIASPEAGAYYANLQVVQLSPTVITINSIVISGSNVVIKFTTTDAVDMTSSFTLTSSSTVNGTYGAISATITSLGSNQFQATTSYIGGGQQFYRILHN